jgi:putative Ca2+/H+ antiporter (TMEM165/GDT1 family)
MGVTCGLGVFEQAFTLTFLAEWGDRSQIATIALVPRLNISKQSLKCTFVHIKTIA